MKTISVISHWPETNTCVLLAAFTSEDEANALADYFLKRNNIRADSVYVDQIELDPSPEKWDGIIEDV